MRILPPIIIIIFGYGLQSSAPAGKRNHSRRKSKGNALQTAKYLEHRDVSLRVYGATKDLERSKLPSEQRVDDHLSVTSDKKTSNNTRKNHAESLLNHDNGHAFHNTSVSRRGTAKEAHKADSNPVQINSLHQATARIARPHLLHSAEKSKHESLSAKSRQNKATSPTKKHKIPGTFRHQRHKTTSKRTKVDEDVSSEGQNIAKTIDSLDDLQRSYSKGVDMDSMDITEVKQSDNNTLSDYFHALNDNDSGGSKNDNTENDYSEFAPTRSSLSWDEMGPPTESRSGDDDFYDAIDNGDEPPPLKMKKIRPTKSHFNEQKGEPTESDSKAQGSASSSQSTDFRSPSQEDFENFFRGMLDHFGYGRPSQRYGDQYKNYDSKNQEKEKTQTNVTSFLVRHYENHDGNLTKLVSLGSPERVDAAYHTQEPSLADNEDAIPTFFKDERDQEGGGKTSFVSSASPSYWVRRPFDANGNAANEQLLREENLESPVNAPSTQPIQLPKKQSYEPPRLQDATLLPVDIQKETRIMGGNISGGQISGGVIKGGQIKAGLIEGGIIKGGQIVGGHITNGTMEGGVVANGQMSGGRLVNGRIEGGKLLGGNVFGGRIVGGSVEGGEIKGGVVAGGRFSGGSMQGGLLKGGEIHSGTIKGGKVEGGILQGGNIEGGEFRFGEISGGTLKSGSMLGGLLKNGSIEGGTLKGGTIEGGVLKGGIMEGGKLKGGLVLAGKIKGGVIEGGVIEGGEIGDGVVITGGKVNATIIGTGSPIDKNQRLGALFKQGEKTHQLGLSVDQQKEPQGSEKPVHGSEHLPDPMRGPQPVTHVNQGLQMMQANAAVKIPLREGTLRMLPQENNNTDDDSLEKLLIEGKSASDDNFDPELSSHRFFDEQDQPNRVIQRKGGKHHVFFDGVGYDIPNDDFVDLIDKVKNQDLVKNYKQSENDDLLKIKSNSMNFTAMTNLHIRPEDLEKTLSFPTKARSSVSRSDKKKGGQDFKQEKPKPKLPQAMKTVKLNNKESERLRPTYHWSLDKLIKDRIPGSPGPAIRTHGEMKVIRGGLHLNGHNAWLGAGDFSGGCLSDPDTCEDGLSFEMTFRLEKDALKYSDMNYIVDSGASTFNSKGFSLYTVQGNLRADIAVADQENCLQIPVTVNKWQDILVTWRKSEGMKMFVNCELKAQTKGSEHCIGCHSKGCHRTDTNTLLMIGRPNYSPHFHCTKFDSGDISFWERYLSDKDVVTLCGASTGNKLSPRILHAIHITMLEI
ncbi:Glutamine-rich protein 2 [Acropora cervicornis]|uniref:Glutamine-rich protein 2 n=1 Tax=Acropora cervicornis TaxID=6130 RepID=A0AAD9R7H3_ACRCE|nr:Glutamine-rich protein 2 [Acropora cervicornis]